MRIRRIAATARSDIPAWVLCSKGRLVKTVFILRDLESEPFRRRINTKLNKGEALHGLREFLLFANKGVLRNFACGRCAYLLNTRQHEDRCFFLRCVRFVASSRPVMRYAKEVFRHYPMFRHRSATPAGVSGNGRVRSLGDNVTSIF
jgi:hypothetical protein